MVVSLAFVGIDPGKRGGMAVLAERIVEVCPIPLVRGGKAAREEYDLHRIREVLIGWHNAHGKIFVTVEKSQPLPMSLLAKGKPNFPGTIANFHRGFARGWEWLLVGLGIPYQLVVPQKWQAARHQGTSGGNTKQRSLIAARRLFPDVNLRMSDRARKDHDGLAEALLLAEYGRRTYSAQPVRRPKVSPRTKTNERLEAALLEQKEALTLFE